MAKQATVSTVKNSVSRVRGVGAGPAGGAASVSKTASFGGLGRTAKSVAARNTGPAGPTRIPASRKAKAGRPG